MNHSFHSVWNHPPTRLSAVPLAALALFCAGLVGCAAPTSPDGLAVSRGVGEDSERSSIEVAVLFFRLRI